MASIFMMYVNETDPLGRPATRSMLGSASQVLSVGDTLCFDGSTYEVTKVTYSGDLAQNGCEQLNENLIVSDRS